MKKSKIQSGISAARGRKSQILPLISAAMLLLAFFIAVNVSAQSYSINWYKIAGGGGASTNGQYTINGTIGQPDASKPMTGGNYSVTGGFWAFISVLQTPGAPALYISHSGNTVTVYWQNISGWTLLQTGSVKSPVTWTTNSSWTTSDGTNYLSLTLPSGNRFFRLANP